LGADADADIEGALAVLKIVVGLVSGIEWMRQSDDLRHLDWGSDCRAKDVVDAVGFFTWKRGRKWAEQRHAGRLAEKGKTADGGYLL